MSNIPDEILQEIFTPVLSVPEETFSSHRRGYVPSEALDAPSSSILLVCKTWLRIATPLLYEVAIISSSSRGQAQALKLALRSNPELGRLIKKIRVEGGYGTSMHTILHFEIRQESSQSRHLELRETFIPQRYHTPIHFDHCVQSVSERNPTQRAASQAVDQFGFSSKAFVYPTLLVADPKLLDTICDRVLFHLFQNSDSLGADLVHSHSGDDDDTDMESPPAASSYLLVCKRFMLTSRPSLRLHVRRIHLEILDFNARDRVDTVPFEEIVGRLPGLLEVKFDHCTWSPRIIGALANHCGTNLQTFRVSIVGSREETINPSIFAQFPQIRSFSWNSNIAFNPVGVANLTNVFSQLEELWIDEAHPSFHTVMSQMRLPSLRTLNFWKHSTTIPQDSIIQIHGGKLEKLMVSGRMASDLDISSPQRTTQNRSLSSFSPVLITRCFPLSEKLNIMTLTGPPTKKAGVGGLAGRFGCPESGSSGNGTPAHVFATVRSQKTVWLVEYGTGKNPKARTVYLSGAVGMNPATLTHGALYTNILEIFPGRRTEPRNPGPM
ncbi:hypothetical protein FB45DRAFT_878708 [Roridomyces roridus]|uniref:Uncharacterized protein n=1 Tax=Roridomyces roridus TaxID=1738132 RepID=A0AAD7B098_9AGAR|nr:hypothetical protein FB45DRAFT_878708 [Roridomyces roridus]